jgi:hypothetical protein
MNSPRPNAERKVSALLENNINIYIDPKPNGKFIGIVIGNNCSGETDVLYKTKPFDYQCLALSDIKDHLKNNGYFINEMLID